MSLADEPSLEQGQADDDLKDRDLKAPEGAGNKESSDVNEEPVPIIEEDTLEKGQVDAGSRDKNVKGPVCAENEEDDDDDDHEQAQSEPEQEQGRKSSTFSLQQHRVRSSSSERRCHIESREGRQSPARFTDTPRQKRGSGIRKSHPKRIVRPRPKRLIVEKQEGKSDTRSS